MFSSLVQQIDTRYGTYNSHAFSNGNTLPLTGVPFGMNYFAPQTTDQNGSWWFNPYEPIYQGIRLTHQPSPWLGDFSQLLLTPVTGLLARDTIFHRQSSYDKDRAIFRPDLLQIHSNRYQLTTSLSPTLYGASLALTSHGKETVSLVLFAPETATYELVSPQEIALTLFNATETQCPNFAMHVRLRFSKPICNWVQLVDDQQLPIAEQIEGNDLHIRLNFDSRNLNCQLATSFISQEQANYQLKEVPSFIETQKKAQETWDNLLSRVRITDRKRQKEQDFFYHCLYRCLLFPQTFYETDSEGNVLHFDTTSGQVKPGIFFTNNGYWDTFRSSYPLLSLLYPDYLEPILEGILQHYTDTGFLPKWLSPDERGIMPGTLVDGVIADACTKGIASSIMPQLLEAMVTTSQQLDDTGRYGRHGSKDYERLGYLPSSYHESVSHSLDYAYSDWAISRVASQLGQADIAKTYRKASLGYRQLFDPETGYIRARSENGEFRSDFSPQAWGKDYAECSAIQATLSVFHDIEGIRELLGGEEVFTDYLLALCQQAPNFETHNYGYEIHEMSEMAQTSFGQLAISNQPSFHIPYLFHWSKRPEYTSLLIKQLRSICFSPDFQGYPGDEDNGSLSAWYIFSCLGFYPVCPGKASYQLGIPQFEKVELKLANGPLTILTHQLQDHYLFLNKACLDGQEKQEFTHQDLLEARQIDYHLGLLPNRKH